MRRCQGPRGTPSPLERRGARISDSTVRGRPMADFETQRVSNLPCSRDISLKNPNLRLRARDLDFWRILGVGHTALTDVSGARQECAPETAWWGPGPGSWIKSKARGAFAPRVLDEVGPELVPPVWGETPQVCAESLRRTRFALQAEGVAFGPTPLMQAAAGSEGKEGNCWFGMKAACYSPSRIACIWVIISSSVRRNLNTTRREASLSSTPFTMMRSI